MANSDVRYADAETHEISVDGTKFSYRMIGEGTGVPVVLCNHLAATVDDWDPRVVDGLAAKHRVVTFDNRGVGASKGETPRTVEEMADDAIAFIKALGFDQIDLLGFSLGGAIAQDIVFKEPSLVRKLILAGIGPGGGIGIGRIPAQAYRNQLKSMLAFTDIRTFLFFTRTKNGKKAARDFLTRLKEKKAGRVKAVSIKSFRAQLAAISAYARRPDPDLSRIEQPVLVANGENDLMVPSINSAHLYLGLPDARLVLYKDAGHGGIFQYHAQFVEQVLSFLST